MGFLTGYGDGTFGPEDPLTYEQLVTALSAVAAWASMDGYALAQEGLNIDEELTIGTGPAGPRSLPGTWPSWAPCPRG